MVQFKTSRSSCVTVIGVAVVCWLSQAIVRADGWHNASLRFNSIDEWLNRHLLNDVDVRGLKGQLGSAELKAGTVDDLKKKNDGKSAPSAKQLNLGGQIQATLTPQQQQLLARKASDCVEILAYMDSKNILPQEFPNFPMQQIPRYRAVAKQLLSAMGSSGAAAVATQLRAELMGAARLQDDISPHRDYHNDLLGVLRDAGKNGQLSEKDITDLRQAASGQRKVNPTLAKQVNDLLDDVEDADIPTMLKWVAGAQDHERKERLMRKVREKISKASVSELLDVLKSKPDRTAQSLLENQLTKRIADGSNLDLLNILDRQVDAALQRAAEEELGKRNNPKYSEVKDQISGLIKLLHSQNPTAASGAREQLESAYATAAIPDCLRGLAQEAEELKRIIWQQLDERVKRAEPDRRAQYRARALETLGDKNAPLPARLAAIELLSRLQDREAVGDLIEMMILLPRETWPKLGDLLRKLTGQNFGPKAGDGVGEMSAARKKWRDWWEKNKGK